MSWGYSYYPRQMSKSEKAAKAARAIARLTKKGTALSPIAEFNGRIAKTFWGKAWCDNIESYRDYAYRLERGRSYVRSGAVIDLKITAGKIAALVIGSGSRPYQIAIAIKPMAKVKWNALVQRAAGKIASLMALAQGELSDDLLADFCNHETGLFPKPAEIDFDCSCPDGASCCKHVAAVLYGVGRRLDEDPSLFFTLRGIDPGTIVTEQVVETLTEGASSELASDNLGDVFGISLDDVPSGLPEEPSSQKNAKPSAVMSEKPKESGDESLKDVRKRLGLTQAALARKFGTSQTVISLIERGRMQMKPAWRKILASISDIQAADADAGRRDC